MQSQSQHQPSPNSTHRSIVKQQRQNVQRGVSFAEKWPARFTHDQIPQVLIESRQDREFLKSRIYYGDSNFSNEFYYHLIAQAQMPNDGPNNSFSTAQREWDHIHFYAILVSRRYIFSKQDIKQITDQIKIFMGSLRTHVQTEKHCLFESAGQQNVNFATWSWKRIAIEHIELVCSIIHLQLLDYLKREAEKFPERERDLKLKPQERIDIEKIIVHLFSIIADFQRYLNTIEPSRAYYEKAKDAYQNAYYWSRELPYMDASALGLALNSSLFFYDMATNVNCIPGDDSMRKTQRDRQYEIASAISQAQRWCDKAAFELDQCLTTPDRPLLDAHTADLLKIFLVNLSSWVTQLQMYPGNKYRTYRQPENINTNNNNNIRKNDGKM